MTTDIYVRRATPSDVDAVVDLHLASFGPEENLITALGPGVLRGAYRWFLESPNAELMVAEADGHIVGITTLASDAYERRLTLRVLPRALLAVVRRPSLLRSPTLRARLRRLRRPTRTAPAKRLRGARVAYTAVRPDHRRQGIGTALKKASIDWCRERGITRMITGIHRDNIAVRRLNEHAGFAPAEEHHRGEMLTYVLEIDPGVPDGGGHR